jgi:UDP-glucose 4-epimerase
MSTPKKRSSKAGVSPLKDKRILITGGLGFIGSNLAHRCLELGAEVTIYDCLDPRSGGNMHNVKDIEKAIRIELNDIRNFEGLSAYIRDKDMVFSCAAYTSHPQSMKEPFIDIDVNCKGVINLLEAARRFRPDVKIVHVGTSTQIGKMHASPVDEWHSEYPLDIYSANKSASEKYMLVYGSAYQMHTSVVRLANNFGPRSNIKSPEFGFMNYFIGLALQGKDIPVFGDGKQLRNVSYVVDSVDALIAAAQTPKADGQVYFAVADRQYTVHEIASAIVEVIGGRIRTIEWPKDRQAIEIGDAVMTNAKIKKTLAWTPTVPLKDGLVKTRDYFQSCLDRYL